MRALIWKRMMASLAAGVAGVVVLALATFGTTAPAQAVSGTTVTNVPWVVGVNGPNGGYCSGLAVTESWVMTAQHCGHDRVVYPTGSAGGYGDAYTADRTVVVPGSDIRLVHLAAPHPIAAYPSFDFGYAPALATAQRLSA